MSFDAPLPVLKQAAHDGKWIAKRKAVLDAMTEESDNQCREIISKKRTEVMKRSIASSEVLLGLVDLNVKRVAGRLTDNEGVELSAKDLKDLAQAVQLANQTLSQAVGLADYLKAMEEGRHAVQKGGTGQGFSGFMVFQPGAIQLAPRGAEDDQSQPIDVTPQEVPDAQ